MKQEIPKSARALLAKQAPLDAHPSPDLLNGYVEQSLTAAEMNLVAGHLTACSECRDVVFLAGAAAEEEVPSPVVAAAAPRQGLDSLPAAAAQAQNVNRVPEKPPAKWAWWKWAVPAVVAVVLVAGTLIKRDRMTAIFRPASTETIAVNNQTGPPQSAPSSMAEPSKPPAEAASKSAPATTKAKATQTEARISEQERLLQLEQLRQRAMQAEMPSGVILAPPNTTAELKAKIETQQAAAASKQPKNQNAAARPANADTSQLATALANASKQQSLLTSGFAATNQAGNTTSNYSEAIGRVMANRAQWRVTSDGHLEHAKAPGDWTRVLAEQAVVFRVVATVGGSLWAGGNDGALFHSSDGGEHWNKIALGEAGSITSIHFDTVQQGSVSTDSGTTWTTSDGGQTWAKQ